MLSNLKKFALALTLINTIIEVINSEEDLNIEEVADVLAILGIDQGILFKHPVIAIQELAKYITSIELTREDFESLGVGVDDRKY